MQDLEFSYLYDKYGKHLPSQTRDIYLLREAIFGFSEIRNYLDGSQRKVLEVGCGPGILLNELSIAYPNNEYCGVDPFISSYSKFNNIFDSINKTKFHKYKIEDLNTDEKFDLIILMRTLEHIHQPKLFLELDIFFRQNCSQKIKYLKIIMKKKEYYTEELEKSSAEKAREIEYQKYYTGGSIVLMFLVLIAMYFVLK